MNLISLLFLLACAVLSFLGLNRFLTHPFLRRHVAFYVRTLLALGFMLLLAFIVQTFMGERFAALSFQDILLFTTAFLLLEVGYLLTRNNLNEMHANNLRMAKEHAEIESLKLQVDAHFLFNSLNTLSYLIPREAAARTMIHKLSDVYRYVVSNRRKEFVTLREELRFCQDYFYLLKERFKDAIRLRIEIRQLYCEEYEIPPLSIQLLLENAVKHNRYTLENPLEIVIVVDDETVMVTNSILAAYNQRSSLNLGLKNLQERFQILTGKQIAIENSGHAFAVTLPVTKPFLQT